MNVIETKNLTYTYGAGTPFSKTAIEDVNIAIKKGEFIGLIGHTGSGKSTLIQQLNGLLRPTSGTVLLNGKDIWEKKKEIRKVRFQVGMVFQYPEYQLFEDTVIKDIGFGPRNMGLSQDEVNQRVMQAVDFVGLDHALLEKSPFDLSGGEKRRAAIAGVIAMDPDVLVLDEPTAGLDPRGRDEILDQIERLHHEKKMTIILVSHSMEDIAKYVDRILVMNHGEKVFDDTPKEVFKHYRELEAIGLAAPQITYVVHTLRDHGVPIDNNITTVEEARDEILALLKKEGQAACGDGSRGQETLC